MPTYKAFRNPNRCPSHPGAVLADILEDIKMPKAEIAHGIGISRQHLFDILVERKPLSPNVAALIGKMFGGGVGIWLHMQAAYDAWHAERDVDVSHVKTVKAAWVLRQSASLPQVLGFNVKCTVTVIPALSP
jgi:antitoxin HigA-1